MAEIQLTQGQIALVDDNIAEAVGRHKWYANWSPKTHGYYAVRIDCSGIHSKVYMHRFIWELVHGPIPEGMVIDHINGDTLDNHIENLRLVTSRGNKRNRIERREGRTSSKYLGVTWYKPTKKWRAQIQINGRKESIGYFDTEEEASKAYQQVLEDIGEMPLR